MTTPAEIITHISIRLDGNDLAESTTREILEVVVDQHVHLPGFFSIRLHDPDLELLDNGPFDLTGEVEIEAVTRTGTLVSLIKGEITSLEPVFQEGMTAELIVQGFDITHRLYREIKSRTYVNKKDSDLAQEIARAAKLKAKVDSTATIYDHIYQPNQSDLVFLMQRAWRIGYECFIDGDTLNFCRPPAGNAGLTLEWGKELVSFRPRLSLSEQVDEVLVKGWDAARQTALVGRAQKGAGFPKIGEPKDGTTWAHHFGSGRKVIVDQPVVSQAEADTLAAARLDEISAAFVDAEGEAYRMPEIKAGRLLQLKALGKRFSGTYLVSRALHCYRPQEGFKTTFLVKGARLGLLSEHFSARPADRYPGVAIGVVTNTQDPLDWGRVKVKFPWLADDLESDWARVVGAGAGPQAGLCQTPEVGDEVALAFQFGEISQPVVLGGLWNGKHALPPPVAAAASGQKPLVRAWRSRRGHCLSMHDDADQKLEIITAAGQRISLDDKNRVVVITSKGQLKISIGQDITIEGSANLNLKTRGDINLEANKSIHLKAAQLSLEGTASASLKAANVSIEGSALAEVKGGLIKLN